MILRACDGATIRFIIAFSLLAVTSACGSLTAPTVDMTGVDPARHSRYVDECSREGRAQAFGVGNPITKCMERRGYRVLVPN